MEISDRRKKHPSQARTKFERWIFEQGGTLPVSVALGVHQVTVNSWTGRRSTPSLAAAAKMIELADGALTLADILEGTRCL